LKANASAILVSFLSLIIITFQASRLLDSIPTEKAEKEAVGCTEFLGERANLVGGSNPNKETLEACIKAELRAHPTSGVNWVELAKNRVRHNHLNGEVVQALAMSELTEPKEMNAMFERIFFSLTFWDDLSENKQRRVLDDLSEGAPFMSKQDIDRLGKICRAKPAGWRDSVRSALILLNRGERPWINYIGL
jgi:hypothetical protein